MVTRRAIIAGAVACPAAAAAFWWQAPDPAADAFPLGWDDLLPEGDQASAVRGVIEHDQIPRFFTQPPSTGLRSDWNDSLVSLPGYVVPIDYDGALVTGFILVPYVGACIHVPPPPANQLVYVVSETPFESAGLFDPVHVTGVINTATLSTELADIGYSMTAHQVRITDASDT